MDSKRNESVTSLTNYFAESTSMHGVSRFVGKPGFFRRTFWVLAVLAGAGVAVYNIWTIFLDYSSWQVSTVVSLRYNSRLRFPAITICNLNPVKRSSIEGIHPKFDSLKTALQFEATNGTAPTMGSQSFESVSSTFSKDVNSAYQKTVDFQRALASMNTSEKTQIGHQINDMLIECSFQGVVCSHSNFTHFYNYMHGNCYTFSPTDDDTIYISRTGPLYGLSLMLYADEVEYISSLSSSVGFKVVVHSPNKMPFPEDDGFDISPGFATLVGVRMVSVERAPHPYGRCKHYGQRAEEPPNIFTTEVPNITYSDKTCERTCLQKILVSECDCCYSIYPCNSDAINIINSSIPYPVGYCNIGNDTCASAVLDRLKNNQLICAETCDPICCDVSHQLEISTAMWPASNYLSNLLDSFLKGFETEQSVPPISENAPADEKDTFFRRNMLKLNVFFKELNYQEITTRPAYDWKSLLSDVGGQAGLWLGFSLLTLGEILELIVDLVIHVCTKPFRSKKVQVTS